MDVDIERTKLIEELGLAPLQEADRDQMLIGLAEAVQKQFLFDVHKQIGPSSFAALQASANMGLEFYNTTLKHLLPNHEDVFTASRKKVIDAFKREVSRQ